MCAAQLCYVDDIQSWSTNEITVNWNSALSWVASFVADQQAGDESGAGQIVRIDRNPDDVTVTDGASASFVASASGDPAASVQWQILDGDGWVDVDGAMTNTLSFVADLDQTGQRYRAVFANQYGSAATDGATLTVSAVAVGPPVGPPPADTGTGSIGGTGGRDGRLGATGTDADFGPVMLAALLLAAGALLVSRQARRRTPSDSR